MRAKYVYDFDVFGQKKAGTENPPGSTQFWAGSPLRKFVGQQARPEHDSLNKRRKSRACFFIVFHGPLPQQEIPSRFPHFPEELLLWIKKIWTWGCAARSQGQSRIDVIEWFRMRGWFWPGGSAALLQVSGRSTHSILIGQQPA